MRCTNVFHITTRCNLDCTYCYEKRNRDQEGFEHHESTKHEADKFLKEVFESEKEHKQSAIVLFGGEPLLNIGLIKYIYEASRDYDTHRFSFNITSNGTVLKDRDSANQLFKYFKEQKEKYNISTSLDISYDFEGQSLRVYNTGAPSEDDVKQAIHNTNNYLEENKHEFRFRIRNTITHLNYKNTVRNSIYAFEKYKNVSRVIHTFAYNNMAEHHPEIKPEDFHDSVKDKLFMVGAAYDKEVCLQTVICSICNKCNRTKETNYKYQIPGDDDYRIIKDGKAGNFDLFNKMITEEKDEKEKTYIDKGFEILKEIQNDK